MYVAVFMGPGPGISPADEPAIIDLCIEQSISAADAGFSLVTFGEQHFNGYEPYCNPFMMGARLAPYMKQTYFGTTVCPLPFHHPLRLAENINLLDVLTQGKSIVGLSAGRPSSGPNMPSDFENFGVDPSQREEIFESRVEIMLKAWSHRRSAPPLIIDTAWDKGMLKGQLMPASHRAGHPLVAIGANSESAVRRAAKLRWPLFLGPCPLPEAVAKFAIYKRVLAEDAVPEAEVQSLIDLSLVARSVIVAETDDAAWQLAETLVGGMVQRRGDTRTLQDLSRLSLDDPDVKSDPLMPAIRFVHSGLICGSPASVVEQILAYPANGIPQLHTRFPMTSPYRPETVRPSFRLFVDEVMPHLSPATFPAVARAAATDDKPGGGMPTLPANPGAPAPR
jgi:alkanesulfonate monooxygenase SsuD/methylene tetrahydromethanopterin reductase-like flavin-dependent oxidoreductase (luciferase family)